MNPIDRVPESVLDAQWQYVAGAAGLWSRLYRSAVAAWRCSRVARAHQRRVHAWRKLRATHRSLRAEIRRGES